MGYRNLSSLGGNFCPNGRPGLFRKGPAQLLSSHTRFGHLSAVESLGQDVTALAIDKEDKFLLQYWKLRNANLRLSSGEGYCAAAASQEATQWQQGVGRNV